jgi:hypothetical protein
MLGLGKTDTVRASAAASSGRSRDIYRRYAAALFTQALLTVDDPALAEQVVDDVAVNERALALVPARGEDDARHRGVLGIYPRDVTALVRAVLRRLTTS